jgi:UDP-glucose 4-epimerase
MVFMRDRSSDGRSVKKSSHDKTDKKAKKTILITGATSALGSHLAKRLVEDGYIVRVGVRRQSSEGDFWHRVAAGTIPYIADLTLKSPGDERLIEDACRGVDVIFHLAGLTYEHQTSLDTFLNVNVIGTENLLNACLKANGDKPVHFIYISSVRVYGRVRRGEVLTEESQPKPLGPYGRSKLMAEQVIKACTESCVPKSINYTIFRLTQMYGHGYEKPYFFKVFRMLKERRMKYIGDGSNHLALVHVDDVVDVLVSSILNPSAYSNTYNVTDGSSYTVRELFEKACKAMDVPPPDKSVNPMVARAIVKATNANKDEFDFLTSDRIISISKAKKELGFSPKRSIDKEGIEMARDFLSHYRK